MMSNLFVKNGALTQYAGDDETVIIPDGITKIKSYAFYCCDEPKFVIIPDSVTQIEKMAFAGCKNLSSVIIGNNVAKIGHSAFWLLDSLTSITIPKSVISIGTYAFSECKNLGSVTIENDATKIGNTVFSVCPNLHSFTYRGVTFSLAKAMKENISINKIYKMVETKDFFAKMHPDVKYPVIGSFFRNHPEDIITIAYIRGNFSEWSRHWIEQGDIETMTAIINSENFSPNTTLTN